MKRSTKFAVGTLVGIALIAISLLLLNNFLEKKVKTGLEDSLKKAYTTYDKVDVKLLDRKAMLINPLIEIRGKQLKVDTIILNNIHLWSYLSDKDIIVGELIISNPVLKIFNLPDQQQDTAKSKTSSKFKNKIEIKNVKVNGGSLQIFEKDSTNHRLYTKIDKVSMEQVRVNSATLQETVPFNYDLILLNSDSIFYDLDAQHRLTAGDFEIDNNKVKISDFRIIPKYSKARHQEAINVEKDRYSLSIDSVLMDSFNWSMQNDSLKIENSFTQIKGVDFDIYRDKLQPDDTSIKPLYSRMIRELPMLIKLDSIAIRDTYIKYEENIHADRESGVVEFSNLSADIVNLTNIDLHRKDFPQTLLQAQANFMKKAPLNVNLEFDISNENDRFHIDGNMEGLEADQMNKFLKPAMNIEAKGDILKLYFNFYGDNNQAGGDMRLEYKNFKVEVLRKDGTKKNKIISSLANLIVKNKALNKKANYKEISFTRDKTKSFWNYLWNLIKNGALKAFL